MEPDPRFSGSIDLRPYLPMYRAEAARLLAEIDAATDAGDPARLFRATHTLKGMSGTMRLHHLAASAARAEQISRAAEEAGVLSGPQRAQLDLEWQAFRSLLSAV